MNHLVVVVLFFTDDFLHLVAAVLLHSLHVCRVGQMLLEETQIYVKKNNSCGHHLSYSGDSHLDQAECVQAEVEIPEQEERQRGVAAI